MHVVAPDDAHTLRYHGMATADGTARCGLLWVCRSLWGSCLVVQ